MHWALVNAFSQFNSNLLSVNTSSENLKMRWKYILTMHIRQKGGRWNAFDSQMELKCFQSEKLGGSRSRSQTNLFCASHSMARRRLDFMRAIKISKNWDRFFGHMLLPLIKIYFVVSFYMYHSKALICLILILGSLMEMIEVVKICSISHPCLRIEASSINSPAKMQILSHIYNIYQYISLASF